MKWDEATRRWIICDRCHHDPCYCSGVVPSVEAQIRALEVDLACLRVSGDLKGIRILETCKRQLQEQAQKRSA